VFIQIIRCKVKPDAWGKMEEMMRRWERQQAPKAPGFKGEYMLREKRSPNNATFVVLFENEQLAQQNSSRPETNQYYQEMLQLIEGEPEFIDTEVVYSHLK
jgi:hypothetical protein